MAGALITNTVTTYDVKGIREDLSDAIYNISPKDTPLISNGKFGRANQPFYEWQLDSLAAAVSNNQVVEGDDIGSTFDAFQATTRLGNYCQISRKTVLVSGTEEVTVKAGRKSELGYQIAKKSAELKRDMETHAVANVAAVAGADATIRVSGSLVAFLKTNTQKGAAGVDPVYTTFPNNARTDGTQQTFTEAMLKTGMSQAWTQGGKPEFVMVNSTQKQNISAFAGVATRTFYQDAVEETAIIGAADVYVSDFGTISVVANRFMRQREAFLLDPEFYGLMYLRPFFTEPLAKTGDAEKRLLLVEYGVKVHTEKAHAGIYDLL